MIYKKRFKGEDEWQEITKEEALRTLLGSYMDCTEVRDLLEGENCIPTMFAEILVSKDPT